MMQPDASVLVVEDEVALAELYELWLPDTYEVRIAHSGREALDQLDDDVEAVLLDRNLPDIPGDDILLELRATYDVPVAFVSGVDPDTDIIPLPIDAYRQKPIARTELIETVETLLERATIPSSERARLAREDKHSALEARISIGD